jgi:cysteine desulfurase/selenocysteine lyase
VLQQTVHGKPLAFLDTAASAQKPQCVIDAVSELYQRDYANVHRGVYELSLRATRALDDARERIARFLGAADPREIVFVRNATEALNLVAYAYGLARLGPGDVVLATQLEHHSNFVPWQYVANRTGAEFRIIPIDDNGDPQLDEVADLENVKVVASNVVSNSLGTIADTKRVADWAHARGAILVCDAAQAAPHVRLDVQALGADFIAVSGHKMCGPSGIGFLWGRTELLLEMEPFLLGGHMISSVGDERTTWAALPAKFEAGTSPVAEAVGLGAAIDYIESVGLEAIEAHEHALAAYALEVLGEIPGITLYGPSAERRAGIVMFNVEGVHPHDMAQILDLEAIAIRAGHHCCQPLMRKLGVPATNRASFYLYTVPEEIDRLGAAVLKAKELMT